MFCLYFLQQKVLVGRYAQHTYNIYIYIQNTYKYIGNTYKNTCKYMQIHAFRLGCQGNPYRMYVHVFACMSWAMHICMYVCCMCMYLCVSVCMCVKYTTCAYSLQMCICTPAGGSKVHPLRHSWAFHTPFALSNPVPSPV